MTALELHSRQLIFSSEDGYRDHLREDIRRKFADALVVDLREKGGIVGPIHENEEVEDDLWSPDAKIWHMSIWANITDMPPPQTYRMMGGPADGMEYATGGVPTFYIPWLPPFSWKPYDFNERPVALSAEYVREGDTQVYIYRSTR